MAQLNQHILGGPPLTVGQRARRRLREAIDVQQAMQAAWWWFLPRYLSAWHRLSIDGLDELPSDGPFVLVSNHASHLDAAVLAAPLPRPLRERTVPIAAADTFFEQTGLASLAATAMNAMPVWRDHCGWHALRALRRRLLDEQCVYILFPEGTRSRTGAMAPFKSGLGVLVAGTTVPVVPCHLSGTFAAFPPNHRLPRPRRVSLRIGRPLVFDHVSNRRSGWDAVASQTEAAVRRLAAQSQPVRQLVAS